MSVSLDSPEQTTNPFPRFLNSISSYDGNVMLAAVISLLLVILFVLLLHVYAKWFLAQARQRGRSNSMSVSHVFRPDRFRHFHTFTFDTTFPSSPSKGLDPSVVSSIPLFVYKMEEYKHGLECVICLSPFEDNDIGRNLPKCGHGFHVDCIDMWLQSHSNCPICRTPLLSNDKVSVVTSADSQVSSLERVGALLNVEVGVTDGNSRLDNLTDLSDSGNNQIAAANDNPLSASFSSSTLSSSLGCSLKRMLSRNRSERKVFPTSNSSELEV
ncbi:RING-H2 finger protein ATL63-like [Durio zibethinus]|uniref:RING-type E3 ubiquitin transferase n=1 Tax=Durio zibethinus TaxID=66656 RepID=A0A6P5ZVW8_DURZI|nr:RING-H2 finger protein ATL63-like [Durio zibethinus]